MEEAGEMLETPEMEAASANIETYFDESCAGSSRHAVVRPSSAARPTPPPGPVTSRRGVAGPGRVVEALGCVRCAISARLGSGATAVSRESR